MRVRTIFRCFLANVTLVLLCLVVVLSFPRQASQAQIFVTQHIGLPARVSFQRLTEQADVFDKQLIRVYASLTQDQTGFYIFDEKRGLDTKIIGADLLPSAQTNEINNWLRQIKNNEKIALPQIRYSKAVLTGWFEGNITSGCFTPKHRLTVIKIEYPETINTGISVGI